MIIVPLHFQQIAAVEGLQAFRRPEVRRVKLAIKVDPLNEQRVSANPSRSPSHVATNVAPARVQSLRISTSLHVTSHVFVRRSHMRAPSPRWTWRLGPREARSLRRFPRNMSTTLSSLWIAQPRRRTPPPYGAICRSSGTLLLRSAEGFLQEKEVKARRKHRWLVSSYEKEKFIPLFSFESNQ